MTNSALYRRLVRRETHSPRSGLAIAIAVLLILVFAWLGTESVLAALGQPALLVAPEDAVTAVLGATSAAIPILTAAGVAAAIIGLVLIVLSLAPARRGRRGGEANRTAAVVDDRVIAQSLARTASYAGEISPEQVRVSIGTRAARVDITPTTGRALDRKQVQEAVDADLAGYDYRPALRARVHISEKGTVS